MPSTQERKKRAGWLSLGWLTDSALVLEIKTYQQRTSKRAGVPVGMAQCVKTLLRAGLDALGNRR